MSDLSKSKIGASDLLAYTVMIFALGALFLLAMGQISGSDHGESGLEPKNSYAAPLMPYDGFIYGYGFSEAFPKEYLTLSVQVPAGGTVWHEVDGFLERMNLATCKTGQARDAVVLGLVNDLRGQYGRDLNLVYPGERFQLQTMIQVDDMRFVCPPAPMHLSPYSYGQVIPKEYHSNWGDLPPEQGTVVLPPSTYTPPAPPVNNPSN